MWFYLFIYLYFLDLLFAIWLYIASNKKLWVGGTGAVTGVAGNPSSGERCRGRTGAPARGCWATRPRSWENRGARGWWVERPTAGRASPPRPVDEHDRRESPRVAGADGRSAAVLQQQHRSIVMLMAAAHAMSVSFPLPSVRLDAFSQPAASAAPGAGDRRLSSWSRDSKLHISLLLLLLLLHDLCEEGPAAQWRGDQVPH